MVLGSGEPGAYIRYDLGPAYLADEVGNPDGFIFSITRSIWQISAGSTTGY